jgi:AraC-like DNA-binding protein
MEDVLRDVDLDAALLEAPWTVIPLSVAGRILDRLAKLLDDNALGIHTGAEAPVVAQGILGQLISAAPTVREMLMTLAEHIDLHLRHVGVQYAETASGARFSVAYPDCFAGPNVQFTGYLMAAVVAGIRTAAGEAWVPRMTELDHRQPADAEAYREHFGPRIRFGGSANVLTIDRAVLALPMPGADAAVAEALREAADRLRTGAVTVFDVSGQVHREIASRLATGEPFDLEGIAESLGLGSRALQYRLELAGTSYEAVLIETRRRLAERYLRDTDLAITEISARLGFSELSAFTRAAQRWFAMPPRSYRNQLRNRPVDVRSPLPAYGRGVAGLAPALMAPAVFTATGQPARGASARRSRAGSGSSAPRSSRP